MRSALLLATLLLLGACADSPIGPPPVDVDIADPAEVTTFIPAIDDANRRVLPSGTDEARTTRLGGLLSSMEIALDRRDRRAAVQTLGDAQAELDACDDGCLIAPERSVIQLTLDAARELMGLSPRT